MAKTKPRSHNKVPLSRQELEQVVKQQIMLSIGLEFQQKDELIRKLPTLRDDQLQQLKALFEQEEDKKKEMLTRFFEED